MQKTGVKLPVSEFRVIALVHFLRFHNSFFSGTLGGILLSHLKSFLQPRWPFSNELEDVKTLSSAQSLLPAAGLPP